MSSGSVTSSAASARDRTLSSSKIDAMCDLTVLSAMCRR
jgi:hypothetical protein